MEFTHIVDRTGESNAPREVGDTDMKRFGVLMLLKKVLGLVRYPSALLVSR